MFSLKLIRHKSTTQWCRGPAFSGPEVTKPLYYSPTLWATYCEHRKCLIHSKGVLSVCQLNPLTVRLIVHKRTIEDPLIFLSFLRTINTVLYYIICNYKYWEDGGRGNYGRAVLYERRIFKRMSKFREKTKSKAKPNKTKFKKTHTHLKRRL